MKTWPAVQIHFIDDVRDPIEALLLDYAITAIDEGTPDSAPFTWRVYFADASDRDAAATALAARYGADRIALSRLDVEDEDWAARSQASLRAIQVGRIIVAPPWDRPSPVAPYPLSPSSGSLPPGPPPPSSGPLPPAPRPLLIVIQPSMGFGTGHHATTRLCLAALQRIDLGGASVLDVGTGSGVLAIAARCLGAARVLGIDDDEDAIASARENLALNPGTDVTLGVVDLRRSHLRPADVVIANLTGGLLVAAAGTLKALSRRLLVLSGFLLSERDEVLAAFSEWTVAGETQEDEWGCVTLSIGAP